MRIYESTTSLWFCTLIMGRGRLCPLGSKTMTLPRLKLQVAVLATRLASTLRKEFDMKFDVEQFWSDSVTVIQYLRNETKRFKIVGNRIPEIRSDTEVQQWHHCPVTLNPADLATRGMTMTELMDDSKIWIHNPCFLKRPIEEWPQTVSFDDVCDSDVEV